MEEIRRILMSSDLKMMQLALLQKLFQKTTHLIIRGGQTKMSQSPKTSHDFQRQLGYVQRYFCLLQ